MSYLAFRETVIYYVALGESVITVPAGKRAALRRRSIDGSYCELCGGVMREGRHIDPLDDADHQAIEEAAH